VRTVFWNAAEARPRAAWRLVIQFALNVGLIVLLTWPLGVQSDSAVIARRPGLHVVLSLLRLVATLGSLWLVGRFVDRRPMADYGLHLGAAWWADLGFGLALGALLVSGGFLLGLALGWLRVSDTLRPGIEGLPFAVAILIPLGQYLCIGVYEELLSRGYQVRNLSEGFCSDRLGPKPALWLAVLSSSAFFALLHAADEQATLLSLLSVLLAGLALGLGTLLTGELAIPIGYHIAFNLFADNVFGLGGQPGTPTFIVVARSDHLAVAGLGGPGGGLVGIAGSLLAMLLIVGWVRWRRGSVCLHTELATPTLLPRGDRG
jgi:membrane protease YdiL (CAAX protease family)